MNNHGNIDLTRAAYASDLPVRFTMNLDEIFSQNVFGCNYLSAAAIQELAALEAAKTPWLIGAPYTTKDGQARHTYVLETIFGDGQHILLAADTGTENSTLSTLNPQNISGYTSVHGMAFSPWKNFSTDRLQRIAALAQEGYEREQATEPPHNLAIAAYVLPVLKAEIAGRDQWRDRARREADGVAMGDAVSDYDRIQNFLKDRARKNLKKAVPA